MSNPDNVSSLSGRLTADPIFMKTRTGEEFQARFTLAVKRSFKNKNGEYDADFIPTRLNGAKRMKLAHMLKKGASIKVMGEMRTDSFTNKDGNRVFSIYLDIESLRWNPTVYRNQEDKEVEEKAVDNETPVSASLKKSGFSQISDEMEFKLPFS